MKLLFVFGIRFYWLLPSMFRQRKCIFKESCSRYVLRIAQTEGGLAAFKALKTRYIQCRPYRAVIKMEDENQEYVVLNDYSLVPKSLMNI